MSILTAALFALALPAAAQAATYTVQPGETTCGGGDLLCGSLQEAADTVNVGAGGDTINVPAGTFDESPDFTKPNTTITGAGPSTVVSGTITFSGGPGTPSVLQKIVVVGEGNSPAVSVEAMYGLSVSDAILAGTAGHGLLTTAGSNSILRSAIFSGTAGNSVHARVPDTQTLDTTLTIESSVLGGQATGIGLSVRTGDEDGALSGGAGDIDVTVRHVTIANSTQGIDLNSSNSQNSFLAGESSGNITTDVFDSIVLGGSAATRHDGVPVLTIGNIADLNFDANTDTTSDASALFVDPAHRNFHLRADSPAIDAAATAGTSPFDIDGQPRTSGAASDLGGDEFVNTPPTAKIVLTTAAPRAGKPVTFAATGTTEQVGDSVVSYRWTFGDGQTATTTTGQVTHTYTGEGPVTASLVAVDERGAQSAPASVNLTILDGTAPAASITKPKNTQKIFQFIRKTKTVTRNGVKKKIKVKTKKRTRIKFAGAAADKSGLLRIYMTLQKLDPSSSTKCRWLDRSTGLRRIDCDEPIPIKATIKSDGTWTYNVRKSIKLPKGTYRAMVYGIDKTGNAGNIAPKASRSIKFTIR